MTSALYILAGMAVYAALERAVAAVRALASVKRAAITQAASDASQALAAATVASDTATAALAIVKELRGEVEKLMIAQGLQPKEWSK